MSHMNPGKIKLDFIVNRHHKGLGYTNLLNLLTSNVKYIRHLTAHDYQLEFKTGRFSVAQPIYLLLYHSPYSSQTIP